MSEKAKASPKIVAFCVYCGETKEFDSVATRNEVMLGHVVSCKSNPLVRDLADRDAEIAQLRDSVTILTTTRNNLHRIIADRDTEISRIKELICDSAPMAWVANQDMDGAKEWEQKASKELEAP